MSCLCVSARVHTPRPGDPAPLVAKEVVLVDDDDETDTASSTTAEGPSGPTEEASSCKIPGQAASKSAQTQSSGTEPHPPSAGTQPHRTFLNDVLSGKISEIASETPGLQLPQSLDAFNAAGGLEPIVSECFALLRMDFPLIAMRRLLLVEPLAIQAGSAPLREREDDVRIQQILSTERELEPTLREITEGEWTLIASKKAFDVKTYLRMGANGRANVKVVGLMPHKLSSCIAPLLHPELMPQWLPGVGMCEKVGQVSNFRFQVYLRTIKIPIPFLAQRDAVVTGYGDIYSPVSIMAYLTSEVEPYPEAAPKTDKLSPESAGHVRMELAGGFCFEIVDGSEENPQTRLSANIQIDIKMKMVPPALIDWFMKHVAAQLISMWSKQSTKFGPGGKLEKLMSEPEMAPTYAELHRRLQVLAGAGMEDGGGDAAAASSSSRTAAGGAYDS